MVNFQKDGADKHVTDEMIAVAKQQIDRYMANIPQYDPVKYKGRGVVMIAGGPKYITCAYVNVKMVRSNGCTLPIELWHIGECEMDDRAKALFDGMDVTFRDCMDVMAEKPSRRVGGWEMNPYAIIHSAFEEVIFLDADNVPLIDVETMLEWPEYKELHAVFWPDYKRLGHRRSIWKLLQIEYQDECEFESGQIVLNKRKCWREIHLTMCLNEYSDTYYQHIWGDKETYHMAWRYLKTEYAMPSRGIHKLRATMCQHDMHDKIILQHRNMDKFKLERTNAKIDGFQRERECFKYLNELRGQWDGRVEAPLPRTRGEVVSFASLANTVIQYGLGDKTPRALELLPSGKIGKGNMKLETQWYVRERADGMHLYICGGMVTADTLQQEDGTWLGRWLGNEMHEVRCAGTGLMEPPKRARTPNAEQAGTYLYVRVGYDKNTLKLNADGKVTGAGSNERAWWMVEDMLCIGSSAKSAPICRLQLGRDGIWRGYWTKHEKMNIELIKTGD